MANDSKVQFNMDNLQNLVKSLKKEYVLEVGILGSQAKAKHDKNSSLTNAEIGIIHEQPDRDGNKMPRRSFLEDSLKFKLNFNKEQFRELRKVMFKQFFIKNAPEKFLQDLGAKCLEIIEEGFATGGFGMWKPLSPRREKERSKGLPKRVTKRSLTYWFNHPVLTDTGKLRKSISFRVKAKGK